MKLTWGSGVLAVALMTTLHAAPPGVSEKSTNWNVKDYPYPSDLVISAPGSDASLPCRAAPPPGPRPADTVLEWTRVDCGAELTVHVILGMEELVKEQASEYVGRTAVREDGTLTLRNATPRDSGIYRCHMREQEGQKVSVRFVSLHVGDSASTYAGELGATHIVVGLLVAVVAACTGASVVVFFLPMKLIEKLRVRVLPQPDSEYFSISKYGDVMLMQPSGASVDTARANGVYEEHQSGVMASNKLADQDWDAMLEIRDKIWSVGKSLQVDPALIAAIISRQSRAGAQLAPSGYGKIDSDCFGLMQINRHYHTWDSKVGPFSQEHLHQGISFLVQMIKAVGMREEYREWSKEQQLKAALACYISGQENVFKVSTWDKMDAITPCGDFANDVAARACRFRERNF